MLSITPPQSVKIQRYIKNLETDGITRVKMYMIITTAYLIFWAPLFMVSTQQEHKVYEYIFFWDRLLRGIVHILRRKKSKVRHFLKNLVWFCKILVIILKQFCTQKCSFVSFNFIHFYPIIPISKIQQKRLKI